MEVIELLFDLCSSAAAVFAIALAYDSHKKVEQIEKQIQDRSKEQAAFHEMLRHVGPSPIDALRAVGILRNGSDADGEGRW